MQIPSVVDLDALLQPIPGDKPAGDSLRYSGIYDEIADARRADDDLNQGEWQTELKTADYRKVVDVAVNALTTLSKDLQIAAWLGEALIKIHGFPGLRDALKLMTGLHANFWDGAFPQIEDNDQEGRANAVSWLETNGALAVRRVPITAGQKYSFLDWQDAKRFDFSGAGQSQDAEAEQRMADLRAQAERENRVTADKWKVALGSTKRAFAEQTNADIEECRAAVAELDRVIEEKYDRNQMPGLSALLKAIDEVQDQAKKILERKRIEEPDAVDNSGDSWGNGEASEDGGEGGGTSGIGGGPLRNRPEALRRLEEVAAYFQRTEPHSPVAYLVQRAVKWGNMPLEGWLEDVIKDDGVLGQLKDMLGLAVSSPGGGDGWGASDETPAEDTSSAASDEW